jgi:Animal haem peroxidase
MAEVSHGSIGTNKQSFSILLPLRAEPYSNDALFDLADLMKGEVDTVKDGADAEENLSVAAGYTYFGQFIDHDLTFDSTSSLNTDDIGTNGRIPSNLRSPRFDLDSVYGDGPDAQPFMYDDDGASLLFKNGNTNQANSPFPEATQDLMRNHKGRAIIGDKRNDENSIVCQIQLAFIKFHNAVVAKLKTPELKSAALFEAARREVRWTYQKLVIEDFLPRVVKMEVLKDLQTADSIDYRDSLYALYTADKRVNLPREFVVAAYRFGHSGVRTGYRLNATTRLSIFPPSVAPEGVPPEDDSLLGFDPLPQSQVIDHWGRFFPSTNAWMLFDNLGAPADGEVIDTAVRLQYSYKIDTKLVDPLTVLPPSTLPSSTNPGGPLAEVQEAVKQPLPDSKGRPSLALLNLLRGNSFGVQGGQAIAQVLVEKGLLAKPLDPKYLVVRQKDEPKSDATGETFFQFKQISTHLLQDTPLWFYILAEAQASIVDQVELEPDSTFDEGQLFNPDIARTQLGWVGGRIIAEVFYGLLDADLDSYVYHPDWQPMWVNDPSNVGDQDITFANMLKFAGLPM